MATMRSLLGDDEGVVGVLGRVELDDRVVVDEVVERAACPCTKLATILPGWSVLRALVMTPASTSGITPSENISVWMPRSCRSPVAQHGVRDLADAELEGRAVLDEVGDVAPDLLRERARAPLRRLEDRLVAGDHGIDVAHMDEAVAERAGHAAR